MVKIQKYTIQEIDDLIGDYIRGTKRYEGRRNKLRVQINDEYTVKPFSQRYELFFTKSTTCVACGLEGTHFTLERFEHDVHAHLNLYGINEEGEEVLLTKDHIQPKSKGGLNDLSNYQTMCKSCNNAKGNKV